MSKAEQFHLKVLNELSTYNTHKVDKYFLKLFMGDDRDISYWKEIYRQWPQYPCYYYQYLACAVRVLKAKQVFEIGADRGASTMMMASEGAKVYSVDIRNGWEYVKSKKVVKIVGDSCVIPKDVDLKKTKLWLIDGLHTPEKVKQELQTYQEYMMPGSVVIMDDINQHIEVWKAIPLPKFASVDIHGNGVGIICI